MGHSAEDPFDRWRSISFLFLSPLPRSWHPAEAVISYSRAEVGGGEKRRCGCGGVVAVLVAVLVAAYRLPALIGSYRARALALQSLLIDTLGRVVM